MRTYRSERGPDLAGTHKQGQPAHPPGLTRDPQLRQQPTRSGGRKVGLVAPSRGAAAATAAAAGTR